MTHICDTRPRWVNRDRVWRSRGARIMKHVSLVWHSDVWLIICYTDIHGYNDSYFMDVLNVKWLNVNDIVRWIIHYGNWDSSTFASNFLPLPAFAKWAFMKSTQPFRYRVMSWSNLQCKWAQLQIPTQSHLSLMYQDCIILPSVPLIQVHILKKYIRNWQNYALDTIEKSYWCHINLHLYSQMDNAIHCHYTPKFPVHDETNHWHANVNVNRDMALSNMSLLWS